MFIHWFTVNLMKDDSEIIVNLFRQLLAAYNPALPTLICAVSCSRLKEHMFSRI